MNTSLLIDHKNGDSLDCRRSNLRSASRSENALNARRHDDNKSGIKGVSPHPSGKWGGAAVEQREESLHRHFRDKGKKPAEAVRLEREKVHGEFVNHGDGEGFLH